MMKNVKFLRVTKGWSIAHVAECCGVNKSTISRIESDNGYYPSYETLCALEDLFGMDHRILFSERPATQNSIIATYAMKTYSNYNRPFLRLRVERTKRNWTQSDLADKLEVDISYYRRIEYGDIEIKEGSVLAEKLTGIFGLPIASLMRDMKDVDSPKYLDIGVTKLKWLINKGDLEWREAAKAIGISGSTLWRYAVKRAVYSNEVVMKLENYYKLPIEELMSIVNDKGEIVTPFVIDRERITNR